MRSLPPFILLAVLDSIACDRAPAEDPVPSPVQSVTRAAPRGTASILPESVFTRGGRLVAYTRPDECESSSREREVCRVNLVLPAANGADRVVYSDSLEHADGLDLLGDLTLLTDERTLYFVGPLSPSMSGLHAVDLATAKHRFITSALSIEIVETGKHRGKLMLLQYPYRDYGRIEIYVVVDPVTGRKLEIMPDTANATEWRRQFGF